MAKKETEKSSEVKDLEAESPELITVESGDETEKSADAKTGKEESEDKAAQSDQKPNAIKRFGKWFWRKKWFTIPALLLIILAVLLAIPVTRYGITGWFWKESIVIEVIDDANNRPVSEATVVVAGQTLKTNHQGKAKVDAVPVGMQALSIQKKNYQTRTSTIEVPLFARDKEYRADFHATGRMTDITVTNRLTGKAVKAALVSISKDDQARTDDSGKAQLVIPADKRSVSATVSIEGYLETKVSIKQGEVNVFTLVPVGKVYFLSKQRGVIDVVKTNLDGSERQTVIEGTGKEDDRETNLLASRDWRYLVLKAKRTTGKTASLYLFDTVKGSLDQIDKGNNVEFTLIGWSGHNFFYKTHDNDKKYLDNGQETIRQYSAANRKLLTIDENQVMSTAMDAYYRQAFSYFYIVDGGLVYTRVWHSSGQFAPDPLDKTSDIVRVNSDGTGKKTVKGFLAETISYIEAKLYEPQEIYFKIVKQDNNAKPTFGEYENGTFRDGVNGEKFDTTQYPTFLMSPSGNQSFWSEPRDGKNTLLVGGKNADNKQEILTKSEFKAYGWFTEDYLLMQKGDSELYITTVDQLKAGKVPQKISDYHKPQTNFLGYGYGYGGQ